MSARPSFIVDVNKCTGCHACAMACQIANDLPVDQPWREVRTFNELHVPGRRADASVAGLQPLRRSALHGAVSRRAYYRDEKTGAVLIDADACLGCRYCAWVCPYGAPRFDEDRGVMTKCTFCVDKQHEGGAPACVTSCPTGALTWGELTAAEQVQDVPGFRPGRASSPAIRIEPLKPGRRPAGYDAPAGHAALAAVARQDHAAHHLRTRMDPGRVHRAGGGPGGRIRRLAVGHIDLDWRLFLGLGARRYGAERLAPGPQGAVVAGGAAPQHVVAEPGNRPGRGLHGPGIRRVLPGRPPPVWTGLARFGAGYRTLAAIDRVYGVAVIPGAGPFHSSQVLGTGLLLAAALNGSGWWPEPCGLIKLVLYVARNYAEETLGLPGSSRRWAGCA